MKLQINRAPIDVESALRYIVAELCQIGRADKAALIAYETGLRDGGLSGFSLEVQKREKTTIKMLELIAANCGVDVEFLQVG